MEKIDTLNKYFGFSSFRANQEEAVDAILSGQDLLMILPTGGGKSLCYQLPTLILSGVTIVVSPLIALMHDQVVALKARGISAEMISSMQNLEEIREIEQDLLTGKIKMLYVAPERLVNEFFLSTLKRIEINYFVIDEAHCLSEWGHEFRDDYRKLTLIKEQFPNILIASFTATATKEVEQDIVNNLNLNKPLILRAPLFRDNLNINIDYRVKDGKRQLIEFLQGFKGESGIIYTQSRRSTMSIAKYLESKGFRAKAYHAALPAEDKKLAFSEFVEDKIDIIVATIAFGMGIDKSNIRFVVHLNLPKSVENYYQEMGRAGRDGLKSTTLLLYGVQDIITQKRFIAELPESKYKIEAFNKLENFIRLVKSQECRHKAIAKYFGDIIDSCSNLCDNCLDEGRVEIDITKDAQMFLSAIYRTNQQFGLHYIVSILKGSKEQRVIQNGHNSLTVYNIGEHYTKEQWLSISDRLIEINAIVVGEFKVYKISKVGLEILKGERRLNIDERRLVIRKIKTKKEPLDSSDYNQDIFEELRVLRRDISSKAGVPPYIVFSDKTLKELSIATPQTKDQMLEINGIGEIKFERYGEEFLKLLKSLSS